MSSKGRKNVHQSRVPYPGDSRTQGQHAHAEDKESSSSLSEREVGETTDRALPRDHRRHEPDNIPGHQTFFAAFEPGDYQGPLRGPGPRDSRLFPAGGPVEDESEGLPRRPNYEARSLSENVAIGRHGPTFEHGNGKAPSLTTRRSITDPGVIAQPALVGVSSASLSHQALAAQSSQLSPLAQGFISLGLGNDSASALFISNHPGILAWSQIDALIAEATVAEKARESTRAQTCLYQALLLRECLKFPDHIGSFFSQLTAKDSRAKHAFVEGVKSEYAATREAIERTTQRNPGSVSGFYDRKEPVISQTADRARPQDIPAGHQIPRGATQSQTPVSRGPDGRKFYTDQHGNLSQPATSRYDSDHHRSPPSFVEMTEQEGRQGGNKATPGRGKAPGRVGAIYGHAPSDPTRRLPMSPELRQAESNRLGGNERSSDKLDERYRIRHDAKKFFERGRVFAVLWPEIAGNGGGNGSKQGQTEPTDRMTTAIKFGETVFSHIRRMVVVKEDHGFCLCLAINTYQGKGVDKHGFSEEDRRAHSIIYIVGTEPSCKQSEEQYLKKKAIAVEKASDDQKLDPMSRLNYKKIYTVEHNVRVMEVGRVTRESLVALIGYWRNIINAP